MLKRKSNALHARSSMPASVKKLTAMFSGALVLASALVAVQPAASNGACDAESTTVPTATNTDGFGGGLGTAASPWQICSVPQLRAIETSAETRSGHYQLAANLDLGPSPWVPLGFSTSIVNVTSASGDGANVTYTTATNHGLSAGDYVVIRSISPSSFASPNAFPGLLVNSVVNDTQFRVASTNTESYVSGGQVLAMRPFTGVFDGMNFTISRINISSNSARAEMGLFSSIFGLNAAIRNLSLQGSLSSTLLTTPTADNFAAEQKSGLLVGVARDALIENIKVQSVTISGVHIAVGGVLGEGVDVIMRRVIVDDLSLTLPRHKYRGAIGGAVGSFSRIGRAPSLTQIKVSGSFIGAVLEDRYNDVLIGGVVGEANSATLSQLISEVDWDNSGKLQSLELFVTHHLGGIVGRINGSTSTLTDSAVTSKVTSLEITCQRANQNLCASSGFSGAVGTVASGVTLQRILVVVTPVGIAPTSPIYPISRVSTPSYTSSYLNTDSWGAVPDAVNLFGVEPKTTSQLKRPETYAGWAISLNGTENVTTNWPSSNQIWSMVEGQYPRQVWVDFMLSQVQLNPNYPNGPDPSFSSITTIGSESDLIAAPFSRAEHSFESWNTMPDGSGKKFDDEQGISYPQQLFAQWRADDESGFYREWQTSIDAAQDAPKPGDTLWASAMERYLPRALMKANFAADEDNISTPEEYVYRITTIENDFTTSVDAQPTAGYVGLDRDEQEDWYENDLGFDPATNPYEFSWSVFVCVDTATAELTHPSDAHYSYASREDGLLPDGGIDSVRNTLYRSVLTSLENGTNPSTRTIIGDFRGPVFFGVPGSAAVLGFTEVGGSCSAGTELVALPVVETSSVQGAIDYHTDKSLVLGEKLPIWNWWKGGGAVSLVDVDGATIGVTGFAIDFNAALWGLARLEGAPASVPPATSPSIPYVGPVNLRGPVGPVCSGSNVLITGSALGTITRVEMGGRAVDFRLLDNGRLSYSLQGISAGNYEVRFVVPVSNLVLTNRVLVESCETGSTTSGSKVNVGSFNGKLVVYAVGLDRSRISWKVAGRWGVANAQGNGLNRFIRPVGAAGRDVIVEIYVDRVLALTKVVRTR